MKIDLSGRIALVTGAAEGIGRGCAETLAAAGAMVVVNDVNAEKGQATSAALGGNARFVQGDMSSEEDIRALVATVEREFGRLDVLVNNAGVTLFKPLEQLEANDWDRVTDLDLRGVYLLTRAALPLLKVGGSSSVVNIASVHAHSTIVGSAAYAAAKGAIVAMARGLCQELGPYGIRINCISPGFIMTPHLERWLDSEPDRAATIEKVNGYHPLGRIGTPEDVGQLAAFLASDSATFITGTNITVDGGLTARLSH